MLPDLPDLTVYDAIILAVGHDAFKTIDFSFVKCYYNGEKAMKKYI